MSDQVFPEVTSESDNPDNNNVTAIWSKGGLTKRELFAAMMMQGMVHDSRPAATVAAIWAVEYADAIVKELAKGET